MFRPHLLGIRSPYQWLLSTMTMTVVMGSAEGITAAMTGIATIVTKMCAEVIGKSSLQFLPESGSWLIAVHEI